MLLAAASSSWVMGMLTGDGRKVVQQPAAEGEEARAQPEARIDDEQVDGVEQIFLDVRTPSG